METYSPLRTVWKVISASLQVVVVVGLPVVLDDLIPSVIDELYRSPQNATLYVILGIGLLNGLRNAGKQWLLRRKNED